MKEKLEQRFKEINDEYVKQVNDVLILERKLETARAKVNSLGGQLTELQFIYGEMFKETPPKIEKKDVKEPISK